MNLANAQSKLTRNEMKIIMAGSFSGGKPCRSNSQCSSGCDDGWYCSDCGTCTKP
ncbi:hypothetical protein LPB248_00760 [Flavobacterium sp. LPB0248]|uniref:hypothetical protein n=1 Tax=Flavobacterium sp. LPB0248 TaxID=2614441 RepID=UPI0015A6732B|nr:hypothetical protein [Flavobacterium sp. LPB0248]QLC64859.1 hypothetical protein LPB248_00760 [Flavobacterium sp. LPB0248]